MPHTISLSLSQPAKNDGGIIAALVLLVAVLCGVFAAAVLLYATADNVLTPERRQKCNESRRLARLLSGWANIGNAVVHALLVIMLSTDTARYKVFFPEEAEMCVLWAWAWFFFLGWFAIDPMTVRVPIYLPFLRVSCHPAHAV